MNEQTITILGILIPFFGTVLGAAAVFLCQSAPKEKTKKIFFGFAAGVMLAASVWSLLIPAMEMASSPFPAAAGLLTGMGLFLLCDRFLLEKNDNLDGGKALALAVTLHNLPEGMAVGVVFAGAIEGHSPAALMAGLVLSAGIALQNFPEGAVISMPLAGVGMKRTKAFFYGAASGIVEPLGAVLSLCITHLVTPVLPFILAGAAGTMIYVVSKELIPSLRGEGENAGHFSVGAGFCLMMILDVLLG